MKHLLDIFKGFSSRIPEPENRKHSNEPPKEPPPVKRHFEFERHPNHPWYSKSQYEDLGHNDKAGQNVRLAPWGRKYTDHAIDRTQPSGEKYVHNSPHDTGPYVPSEGRSIMPVIIERTIAYGQR